MTDEQRVIKPEIISPADYWPQLQAARERLRQPLEINPAFSIRHAPDVRSFLVQLASDTGPALAGMRHPGIL